LSLNLGLCNISVSTSSYAFGLVSLSSLISLSAPRHVYKSKSQCISAFLPFCPCCFKLWSWPMSPWLPLCPYIPGYLNLCAPVCGSLCASISYLMCYYISVSLHYSSSNLF
jgi:hypothetical protein